jgi:hypothetical protein
MDSGGEIVAYHQLLVTGSVSGSQHLEYHPHCGKEWLQIGPENGQRKVHKAMQHSRFHHEPRSHCIRHKEGRKLVPGRQA